ncbi:MAG TPA: hypothetical protein ENN00_00580 [Bacillaceae bacterium]|nr:hypothetical protein [Bacillaceae bacterium]
MFFSVSALAAGIGFHAAERRELSHAPGATRGAFLSALERGDPDAAASYAVTRDEEGRWHPVSREWGTLLAAAYRSDPSYREWLGNRLAFEGGANEAFPSPFSLIRVGRAFRVYLPALYVWVPEGGECASISSQTGTFELLAGRGGEETAFPLPEVRPGRFGPFPPVSGELRYACLDPKGGSPEGGAAEPWFAVRRLAPARALEADAIVWWLGTRPSFDVQAPEVLEVAVRFAVSFDEALRKRDASLLEGTSEELRRLFADMIAQGELPAGTPELRPRRIRLCPSAQNPRRVLDGAGGELLEADVEEEWENDNVVRWRYRFRREGDGSLTIVAAVRVDMEAVSPLPADRKGDFLPERPPPSAAGYLREENEENPKRIASCEIQTSCT